jgi:hypothetical protein
VTKSRRIRWIEQVTPEEMRNAYKIFAEGVLL